MDNLQPQKKSNSCVTGLAAIGVLTLILAGGFVVLILAASGIQGSPNPNQVTLRAEAWNDGKVYLWHDLIDGPTARYTALPNGTRCAKIDRSIHKIGDGSTAIFYHHLDCNGVTGYVQTDQAR